MVKNKEKTNTMKRLASGDPGDEPIAKRLRQSTRTSFGNMLKSLINNPGFQHIAEKIFLNIDKHSLLKFRLVNSSWKRILDRPMFWYRNLIATETDVWLLKFLQKFDPDDYEEKKYCTLKMIKIKFLETRSRENSKHLKKIKEENRLIPSIEEITQNNVTLNYKQIKALKNQMRVTKKQLTLNEKIMQLISDFENI